MTTRADDATRGRATAGRPGALAWLFGAGLVDRVPAAPAWILSAVLLAARFWLAEPFFRAGLARAQSWGSQSFLFEHIHPVPFLSPGLAALVTTAAELVLPVALVLGVLGRLSALGLAVMAATIFFVVGQTPQGQENGIAIAAEQIPWMLVGLAIFIVGPGRIAIDEAIRRFALRG
ncbi:MAG: DoxX family protein [Azospirillaceae bacterium]